MHRLLPFLPSAALAHPGHGQAELLHGHGEWLLLIVAIGALVCWKLLRKP